MSDDREPVATAEVTGVQRYIVVAHARPDGSAELFITPADTTGGAIRIGLDAGAAAELGSALLGGI